LQHHTTLAAAAAAAAASTISLDHKIMVQISNKVLVNHLPSLLSSICTNHASWKGRGMDMHAQTIPGELRKQPCQEDIYLSRSHIAST
jgi:hypothetical protein